MQLYLVGALVFALLVAVFAVQNTTMVTIGILMWEFKVSLVLVILGSAAVGALCVLLVGIFKNVGAWRKQRELQGQNKLLEERVKLLETQLKEKEEKAAKEEEEKNKEKEKAVQVTSN